MSSYRSRQILAVGAGALAVIIILGYLIWLGYREAIHSAEATTRGYAAILETRFDATLRRADADLRQLARDLPVAALNKQAVARYAQEIDAGLDTYLIDFPEVSAVRVFDTDGDLIYTTNSKVTPRVNIADRDHFRQARDNPQNRLGFSETLVGRTSGKSTLVIAKALRTPQGDFRGVLTATLDWGYWLKLFQSLDVGAQGNVAIYRSDNFTQVLRHPAIEDGLNRALPASSPVRTALGGNARTVTMEITAVMDGVSRIYSYHRLPSYPFYVVVGVARDHALASWRSRSLSTGLSALLLGALLTGLLLRLGYADAARNELAAIVEHSNDAIYSRALDGTILSWNAGAERMLGYSPAEAIGKPGDFSVPPSRASNLRVNSAQLLRGEVVGHETDRMTKDGRVINVFTSHSPVRDSAANIVGVSVILRDITALKQAQAAVTESEMRFRATFEQAAVGIAHFDLQGRNIQVNRRYCDIVGYPPEELVGKPPGFLNYPGEGSIGTAQRAQLLSGAIEHYSQDKRYVRKDGKLIWVTRTESLAHDGAGAPLYFIRVIEDITERKQAEATRASLEAQLRESQKMQAIGTLAGGIAHDFNNIIALILGNVELARQDAGHVPQALASLERIRVASVRARDLVRQILAFSRRQPATRKPIVLTPVVEETASLLRATLPACLSLEVHCASAAPPVLADPTQIQQALINLVTNAMQAMSGGPGRIGLSLDTVVFDDALIAADSALRDMHVRNPGPTVRLVVSDNGPGMDAATKERIFEPFFTTKPVGEGTGLGLSVVHGIVESHEGVITFDSAPGMGTTFTLYFPATTATLSDAASSLDGAEIEKVIADGGPHVLYIDDDADLGFMFRRLLERRGYRISVYVDAQEALEALRAAPADVDLVLTDYNMPGMSGLDVANEVRAIRAELPVAVISGYIDDDLQERAAAAGVCELMIKSDSVEGICAAVQRLAMTLTADSRIA